MQLTVTSGARTRRQKPGSESTLPTRSLLFFSRDQIAMRLVFRWSKMRSQSALADMQLGEGGGRVEVECMLRGCNAMRYDIVRACLVISLRAKSTQEDSTGPIDDRPVD